LTSPAAASPQSFALVVVMAGITLSVHFVLLTVGRQVPSGLLPGFDRFFSFNWPSVAYALDILAWDYCFGLALLAAAPVFTGGPAERAVRTGLDASGVCCAWRGFWVWSRPTCRSATSASSGTEGYSQ